MTGETLKHRAYHEMKEYLVIVLYLWLIFGLLTLHTAMILSEHQIDFALHGVALVNALALGKVVLVLRKVRFADRFNDSPLIYPTLLKSAVFSAVLACFKILEDAALGMLHGETFRASIGDLAGGTWKGILSLTGFVCILLVPFFGYTELARVFGPGTLGQFFFRPSHSRKLPKEWQNALSNHSTHARSA